MSAKLVLKKPSKYRAKGFRNADGIWWHSQREYKRWGELQLLEKAGKIKGLQRQIPYSLLAFGGLGVGKEVGKWIADFVYWEDSFVVEDCKGLCTPLYRWKRRHFELQTGIKIRET